MPSEVAPAPELPPSITFDIQHGVWPEIKTVPDIRSLPVIQTAQCLTQFLVRPSIALSLQASEYILARIQKGILAVPILWRPVPISRARI
jgi:hypothetical protein